MNRGKDDEKITGPMFPRLHVNDADKGGGPRAPPRNKMALYEQLSIPSQRFSSGVNPTNNNGNLVASGSSSQGVGPDRNLIFPHHKPPLTPAYLAEKSHSRNSDRTNTNILLPQVEQRKKVADVDDFTVPVFVQSGNSHRSNTHDGVDKEKIVPLSTTNSGHVLKPHVSRYPKKTSDIHPGSRQQSEGVSKSSISNIDHFVETTSKLTSEKTDVSTSQKHSADPRFDLTRFHKIQKDSDSLPEIATRCDASESVRVIEEARVPQSGTGSRLGGGYYDHSNNEIEHHGEKTRETSQLGNQDNGDDLSETSVVDSISGLDISPDDVVGIIGQKHFWKARKAISTQQRVFAVQVFELHRLIKVQQLIAGSSNLTIEGSAYPGKPTFNPSPANNISTEDIVKPLPQTVKQKDDSEKPNQKIECSAENAVGKKSISVERNNSQPSTHGPYLGPTPQPPVAPDMRMTPWLNQSHGQGQQWLVPIMSPSEGLVYKPYGGPGFPGAFYGGGGGCGPFGPSPMPGNYMNLGYGIPPNHYHPGFGHGYFNPYGMPIMMNPGIPSSEQTNQFNAPGPHCQAEHLSGPGANSNFHMQNQSSCDIPSQKNDPVSRAQKIQSSKDTERQGSIASSPGERMQGEIEAPTNDAPVVVDEVPRSQPTRVIKVVPRNPRLATESAARIFRSIQKERAN